MSQHAGSPRWIWPVAVALLIFHAVLAMSAVRSKSITTDEIFHVTGGYLYNRFGDFRIHPDNGVLPQRWQALPAVLREVNPPVLENNERWRQSSVHGISHQFFYESGNDHWPMLMQARAMSLVFSLGCGLLVFLWARRLAGDAAGLVALGLLAFSPTFLAHGPLATSDVCAGLLLTASAGAFWWQLRAGGIGRLALSAVVFGLACLSKYSAVLLLPVFAGLAIVHAIVPAAVSRHGGRTLLVLAVHAAVAVAAIWAFFDFRYSAFAPDVPGADHFIRNWDWMLARLGAPAAVINLCRDWRLLPEAFLFGFTHTYVGAQARAAFLAGEYSTTGWVRFFPLAFLWKSTFAELGAGLLAALAAGWHWRKLVPWLVRLSPLLLWGAIYGAAALSSKLNIGHRHLVPLYPALFILGGVAVARLFPQRRVGAGVAIGLVALQAMVAAGIHPHYLAYFNPAAGGPDNGHRLLVDSSLDWGQDLPGLSDWLRRHNAGPDAAPVFLSYFGSGRPDYHGINATRMPFVDGFGVIPPYYETRPGLYCVSATMLQNVYSPVGGNYRAEDEHEYQATKMLAPLFHAYWKSPETRTWALNQITEAELLHHWQRHDWLRFSRLCAYLRVRPPDAVIGYSIFIHRLSAAEIAQVLNGRYSDWLAALESPPR
jgi:4-amino-4-deoxy-L-arabinose transferase-like glycosyltransferase